MVRAAMASGGGVAIDLEAWSSGGHGKLACVAARIVLSAPGKVEGKPSQNDARRRDPRPPATPTVSVLLPHYPSGEAGKVRLLWPHATVQALI
jgi:hypothetical protein